MFAILAKLSAQIIRPTERLLGIFYQAAATLSITHMQLTTKELHDINMILKNPDATTLGRLG
jgi:hypothetical protein